MNIDNPLPSCLNTVSITLFSINTFLEFCETFILIQTMSENCWDKFQFKSETPNWLACPSSTRFQHDEVLLGGRGQLQHAHSVKHRLHKRNWTSILMSSEEGECCCCLCSAMHVAMDTESSPRTHTAPEANQQTHATHSQTLLTHPIISFYFGIDSLKGNQLTTRHPFPGATPCHQRFVCTQQQFGH